MRRFLTMSRSFKVSRQMPELISPARLTPREIKPLSDIDDQDQLRLHLSLINFYRNRSDNDTTRTEDPVKVIKAALAETLVSYYPFAGRVKELSGGKLAVDCTGEGAVFVEADSDGTLEEFQGNEIQPPFPCLDKLMCSSLSGITDSPLLHIQVTRFRCGGFSFGLCFNHTIADGVGIAQFQKALSEIARGAPAPSVTPVWRRELLKARDPPRVTCVHKIYEDDNSFCDYHGTDSDMVRKSFFFGPAEISALRNSLRLKCSSFDLIAACLWRCRTIALQFDSDEEVRFIAPVNARSRVEPALPEGYYGNAIAIPVAVTTAGKLIENPLSYAVDWVIKAKSEVTDEYMKSLADLIVLKGRLNGFPQFLKASSYIVSDTRRLGLDEIDFGWGNPVYAGPAISDTEPCHFYSFLIPKMNKQGVKGMVVPVCLPKAAMKRFSEEIEVMVKSFV
ncbi:OLC1v1003930C1 [Oldenlandia corymbosa var. corymbosa]|uniref:OLC1v1003930C1 n=1 Tax=Oldenlandia corymbosa var. corymbosa TaxID=529605 RepID=A0AAV1DBC2_OLDCO|nr:OLC1v1003930C1 [Oldenlandia corymbosa var. corymbosa]